MSTHRFDALPERNKHLQTQQKRGGLNGRSGISEKKPGVLVTLTEGDRGPARAALAKPSVRFKGNQFIYLQIPKRN